MNARRRFFAEEIEAIANLRNPALVDALATVPREKFLRPGPWTVKSEADFAAPPRQTPDADPRHVCHNLVVAIDPSRQLYNGTPSLLAMAIDALAVGEGSRVLHVGAGLGFYTALMAHCVGPSGHVTAIEVDEQLAREARASLGDSPWVGVHHGDASDPLPGNFDAILVNAGVTHPLAWWLDALAPGGRMVLPITGAMKAMGPTIGKGLLTLITKRDDATFDVRVVTFVAIYSAVGIRDEALGDELGKAMARMPFPPLKRLRRDPHERGDSCWFHTADFCFSV
ncbi:MAG TPA: methyltransferase domain-containing protein [Vicinamibacterales bacterium]